LGRRGPPPVSKEECGGSKAQRKIRVRLRNDPNAALHNRLKLLESESVNGILNRSPH
jgi:hypothetical protein